MLDGVSVSEVIIVVNEQQELNWIETIRNWLFFVHFGYETTHGGSWLLATQTIQT